MMRILTALAVFTAINAMSLSFNEALSQIESGNNDYAIGKNDERGRYQICPKVWRKHSRYPISKATDPNYSFSVLQRIWIPRIKAFEKQQNREATIREYYILWHRPAEVLKPSRKVLERAKRFENLVNK
jgi:hypothetical protein